MQTIHGAPPPALIHTTNSRHALQQVYVFNSLTAEFLPAGTKTLSSPVCYLGIVRVSYVSKAITTSGGMGLVDPLDTMQRQPITATTTAGNNKCDIRKQLGLENLPTVLIVGGGDGMGGIVNQAIAVGERFQKLAVSSSTSSSYQLIVVCGNNKMAQTTLSPTTKEWGSNINIHIYVFVNNMDEFMRAADILVTNTGPGTIAEASICGLPCILSSLLPGQEAGNVDYAIDNGFGCYQSNPDGIADTVEQWFVNAAATTNDNDNDNSTNMIERMRCNSLITSRPDATMDIARDLATMLYKWREELKKKGKKNNTVSLSSQVTATMAT
jgi:UDP-N-acetylglucosamine:LPS N-acetylglucosamine transferase